MAAGKKRQKARPPAAPRRPPAPDPPADTAPETPARTGLDLVLAVGLAAIAACVFAVTFSTHVALGDAPESVAGVKALGILHSPGYPAYVLAAHAFSEVVHLGSWAFRVNLFSLVCSCVMIGALFLLARCFGASRVGAAIGTLAIGLSASFWFNAGFAKHYPFTGMLVAISAVLVMRWREHGRGSLLVIAAALLGLCMGSGWEIALILVAASVALFLAGPRRPSLVLALSSVLVMGVIAVAAYVFLFVRAGQHPPVNWGEATSSSRLLALLSDRDFRAAGIAPSNTNVLLRIPLRVGTFGGIVARDIGLGAAVLAIAGAVIGWRRLELGPKLFLGVLAVLNLVAVTTAIGFIDSIMGFRTSVISGGYLLDLMLVLAVLVSIAFTPTVRAASDLAAELTTPDRYQSQRAQRSRTVYPWIAVAIAVVVLVPSLIFHYQPANHRMPPLADRYGSRVLTELPPHAVLVILEADWAFPSTYRQVVDGQRRDVSVMNVDSMGLEWYRDELARELNVPIASTGTPLNISIALIKELQRNRPVYFDTSATQLFQEDFGYRANGLVAEVVSGKGPQPISDLGAASTRLQEIDRADGVTGPANLRFPNDPVLFFHERAHIELAKAYLLAHNTPAAITELQRGVAIYPDDTQAAKIVLFMQQHGTGAEDVIKHM